MLAGIELQKEIHKSFILKVKMAKKPDVGENL